MLIGLSNYGLRFLNWGLKVIDLKWSIPSISFSTVLNLVDFQVRNSLSAREIINIYEDKKRLEFFSLDVSYLISKNSFVHATIQLKKRISILLNYKRVFNCDSLQIAKNNIALLESYGLTSLDITKVIKFVDSTKRLKPTDSAKYIQLRHLAPGELPRNLQFHPNGDIFIVFNQLSKSNDKPIGEGHFKTIKKAINLSTGEIEARLSFLMPSFEEFQLAKWENFLLSKLIGFNNIAQTHRNSLVLYRTKMHKASIMQKYYNGGNLVEVYPSISNYKQILFITHSILAGLSKLHEQKIIHRDIKPENIFTSKNPVTGGLTEVVLGDFGLSYDITTGNGLKTRVGSPLYFPPEIARLKKEDKSFLPEKINTFALDSWSVGLVLLVLHAEFVDEWKGKNLPHWIFQESDEKIINEMICNLKKDWLPKPIDTTSIAHVIWEFLQVEPEDRLPVIEGFARISAKTQI